jgi:thiamine biosynthesis lipoprotein
MESIRLAFSAMATRFEIVILDENPVHARAAAEEAQREILRIEAQCNFYSPASELSRINREASGGPIRCTAAMMRLLQACKDLHQATQGYFDPTIAPALKSWGLRNQADTGRIPSERERSALVAAIGFETVDLDHAASTVCLTQPHQQLDLGGIAKGWALDEARLVLEESGIEHALLHGGTSTAIGLGRDPEGQPWKIGVEDPYEQGDGPFWIMGIPLRDQALSVSGVRGKWFIHDSGEARIEYGHVMDPMTGMAVSGKRLTVAVANSATTCDAWSTALLTHAELSIPDEIMGTALLKTDSGWTAAPGSPRSEWSNTADLLPFN